MKNNNSCDKSAKKYYNDIKLCATTSCKNKQYNNLKLKNIPKLENPMLSLGKIIIKKLDEKKFFKCKYCLY